MKKKYETPKLKRHGSFTHLTRGTSDGDYLDESYPAGTPKSQLTFS